MNAINIQQNSAFCNHFFNLTLGTNNLVPNTWYHKILRGGNKPDDVGITILSELLQLHLLSEIRAREFQLGYAHFKTKFNYTYEQVYEALLRLEHQYLVSKKGKHIVLNVENVLALSDSQKDKDNDGDDDTIKKLDSSIDNPPQENSLNIDLYIDITKEDIEVKKENYISGSRFNDQPCIDKNTSEQTPDPGKNSPSQPEGIIKTAKKRVKNLRQSISSFYPLIEEDAQTLRFSSGREFNLHFINELILRLGTKYPEHGFYTKKLFMKYMATLLANEMRQAVNVNNEGFRFKRADGEAATEDYLARIEGDYSTKASDQIRKKVAASFEPAVAYKILTSCYFPEEVYEGKYEIKQRSSFELSESQRDRLYNQISAVFGDRVRNIQITKNFKPVVKLQQITTPASSLDTATLWGRVRSGLIASYGEAIDKSWFSRLETTEDASSRSLILKGASFLTDYIQTNYSHVIERLCREENYQLKFC